MADGKTIQIKDILDIKKYRVFTKTSPVDITPTGWFTDNKVPKKHRYSYTIVPMCQDDLDMISAYREQSDAEAGIDRSMAVLGVDLLDLWTFPTLQAYTAATIEEREKKLNRDLFKKVLEHQESNYEAKIKAKKILRTGKEKIINSCTKFVFIGDSKMEYDQSTTSTLDSDLKEWLYQSILEESTLNDEDRIALR